MVVGVACLQTAPSSLAASMMIINDANQSHDANDIIADALAVAPNSPIARFTHGVTYAPLSF